MAIPRKIYALWLQGLDTAPEIAKICLQRWKILNPEWDIVVLDRGGALKAIGDFPVDLSKFYQPQAFSDILRLKLLQDGGVWVDATAYPTVPLKNWIDDAAGVSGFFAFTGHQASLDVSSWFLAAEAGNTLCRKWWAETCRYWRQPRKLITFKDNGGFQRNYEFDPMCVSPEGEKDTFPFFWVMYLFSYLRKTDSEFERLWEKTPKLSGLAAHTIQFTIDDEGFRLEDALMKGPVQKLTWKSENFSQRFLSHSAALINSRARPAIDESIVMRRLSRMVIQHPDDGG